MLFDRIFSEISPTICEMLEFSGKFPRRLPSDFNRSRFRMKEMRGFGKDESTAKSDKIVENKA